MAGQLSKPNTQFGVELACTLGSSLMKKSNGRIKKLIWDLGPATFNRMGEDTSIPHILELYEEIALQHGFAHYRYGDVWCHEPNQDDMLAVWRHAEAMRSRNSMYPELPQKPLSGTFRKVHMVTGLQLWHVGKLTFPKSGITFDKSLLNVEAQDAMTNGVYCVSWDYEIVKADLEGFKKLMASDNWDVHMTLGDDEITLAKRMLLSLKEHSGEGLCGDALDKAILKSIKAMSGKSFAHQDFVFLLNWIKTTSLTTFAFIQPLQKYVCDPAHYVVPTSFFGMLALVDPAAEWLRVSQLVRMLATDPRPEKNEVKVINGKVCAQAVNQKQIDNCISNIEKIKKNNKTDLSTIEKTLEAIIKCYWTEKPVAVSANDMLCHLGGLFKKVAIFKVMDLSTTYPCVPIAVDRPAIIVLVMIVFSPGV